MTTTPTTTTTGAAPTSGTTTISNPKAILGKDDFLRLLVAQLKYQDPLKPSDQSQMMSQMAQFSMVEGINNLQSALTTMQTTNAVSQGVGLIGKELTYLTPDGANATGKATSVALVDGKVTIHVGDTDVALADVLKVSAAPTATTSTSTTTTTTTGSGVAAGA